MLYSDKQYVYMSCAVSSKSIAPCTVLLVLLIAKQMRSNQVKLISLQWRQCHACVGSVPLRIEGTCQPRLSQACELFNSVMSQACEMSNAVMIANVQTPCASNRKNLKTSACESNVI